MLREPAGAHGETFRKLRTSLEFVNPDGAARTIMVTSAVEQEGKSTTIANLAVALARGNRRVALVDLDLRRPYLSRLFHVGGRPGITDVAVGARGARRRAPADRARPGDVRIGRPQRSQAREPYERTIQRGRATAHPPGGDDPAVRRGDAPGRPAARCARRAGDAVRFRPHRRAAPACFRRRDDAQHTRRRDVRDHSTRQGAAADPA